MASSDARGEPIPSTRRPRSSEAAASSARSLLVETGASPEARQLRHEKDSLPLMENLFSWMAEKLHRREVEPNSKLGRAINYSLSRRDELLAFIYYPGCPLDNNQVEQRLKLVVLHRKNSLFFKHQTGAWVSDILMSLIATAGGAGINVFDYLTTLQRKSAEVRAGPEKFLPWNFRNSSDQ